jgi:hypothetical protein
VRRGVRRRREACAAVLQELGPGFAIRCPGLLCGLPLLAALLHDRLLGACGSRHPRPASGRDFSANSTPRDMAAPVASLSSRIHRGERDKIGPADNARRAQARRR